MQDGLMQSAWPQLLEQLEEPPFSPNEAKVGRIEFLTCIDNVIDCSLGCICAQNKYAYTSLWLSSALQ